MMEHSKEYRAIKAWGQLLGSLPYYVASTMDRAQKDGAPADAIFQDETGRWHTVRDINSKDTLQAICSILARMA
jgi:hypothetical protein